MYLYGVVVVTLSRGMRQATEVDGDGGREGADAEPAASSEREPARPE